MTSDDGRRKWRYSANENSALLYISLNIRAHHSRGCCSTSPLRPPFVHPRARARSNEERRRISFPFSFPFSCVVRLTAVRTRKHIAPWQLKPVGVRRQCINEERVTPFWTGACFFRVYPVVLFCVVFRCTCAACRWYEAEWASSVYDSIVHYKWEVADLSYIYNTISM